MPVVTCQAPYVQDLSVYKTVRRSLCHKQDKMTGALNVSLMFQFSAIYLNPAQLSTRAASDQSDCRFKVVLPCPKTKTHLKPDYRRRRKSKEEIKHIEHHRERHAER